LSVFHLIGGISLIKQPFIDCVPDGTVIAVLVSLISQFKQCRLHASLIGRSRPSVQPVARCATGFF
jgi:hypothetical protein